MRIACLFLISFVVVSCSACYAQEEEKLTITTYYPSPAGVYATLRIVPSSAPACDASVEGKMYYDGTTRSLNICSNSTAGVWGYYPVPGAGGFWTVNGANLTTANNTWHVGIGKGAPLTADLDVGGYLHVTGLLNPNVSVQGAYFSWNNLTGGTGETDFINNQGGGVGGFAFMNTPNTGTPITTLMFINGTGSVGMGTISPTTKLDVKGTINATAYRMTSYYAAAPASTVLSSANTWTNTLASITLTAVNATKGLVMYNMAGHCTASVAGTNHIVSRVELDGAVVRGTPTIISPAIGDAYYGLQGQAVVNLTAGAHTFLLKYRTPSASCDALYNGDWADTSVNVLLLGN